MDLKQLNDKLAELSPRVEKIVESQDLVSKKVELARLEEESQSPEFWQQQEMAQATMRKLGRLRHQVQSLDDVQQKLEQTISDLSELQETDAEMLELIAEDLNALGEQIDKLEVATFLSGKYDHADAILSIHAGQGGTEANDWAEMLLRMYLRYCNTIGWEVSVLNQVVGTEVGISTVTVQITGDYAYGYLKHEQGTHRLVRNSPFNSAGLRQTSFAGVEVMPKLDQEIDIEIPENELEFTAVRSSGAGGQNVNKVATSVRLVHLPTGLAVTSSASRSQSQNRQIALDLLKSRLAKIEEEKLAAETAKLKGEHKDFAWGNQIRNYVLQPYKLVKDVRTGVETSNTDAVLDGDLQEFIDAEIKQL